MSPFGTVTTGANGNANFVTIADILVAPSDPAVAVTSYTVVNPAGGQLPGVTANSIAGCSISIGNFANNPVVYPCTATINAGLTAITVTGFPASLPTGGAGGFASVMVTYNMWTATPVGNDTVEHQLDYTLGGTPATPLAIQFNNGGTFVSGPATTQEMSIIPGIPHETRPTPAGVVRFITGFVNTGNSAFTMSANADWIARPQLTPGAATAPTCTILDVTGTAGGSIGACNYNPGTGVISGANLPSTINVNGRVRFELTYTVQPGTAAHTVLHAYDTGSTGGTSVSDSDDAPWVYPLAGSGAGPGPLGTGGAQSVPLMSPWALGGMGAVLALVPPCLARRRRGK